METTAPVISAPEVSTPVVSPPGDPKDVETYDTSIHSTASSEMHHQHGSSSEQIVKDLLKACFDADKTARTKIQSQIQNMFTNPLGMFQAF